MGASAALKAIAAFRGISCARYCREAMGLSADQLLNTYVVNYLLCIS